MKFQTLHLSNGAKNKFREGKMFVFLDKALTDNDKINLSAFVRLKVI